MVFILYLESNSGCIVGWGVFLFVLFLFFELYIGLLLYCKILRKLIVIRVIYSLCFLDWVIKKLMNVNLDDKLGFIFSFFFWLGFNMKIFWEDCYIICNIFILVVKSSFFCSYY